MRAIRRNSRNTRFAWGRWERNWGRRSKWRRGSHGKYRRTFPWSRNCRKSYWNLQSFQSFQRCKQMLISQRRGWEHLRTRSRSRTGRPGSRTHRLLYGSSITHSRVIYTPSYSAAQEVAGKEAKMKMSTGARARVMIKRSVATYRGNRRYRRCLAR